MENRVALVTGASRGIGKAIALQLMHAGHTVIGTATTSAGADRISEFLDQNSSSGKILNLSDIESLDDFVSALKATPPTIVVHNAGITNDNLLLRLKDDDIVNTITVNLMAPFMLTRRLLKPMMKAKFGRIIFLGSVTASMGNTGQSAYTASKAGLGGIVRSIARELGSRNITANLVEPGFVKTDMTAVLGEDMLEAAKGSVPLNRLAEPEEVAELVAWIASEKSSYITGETIQINGGLYMK